jgi:SAM-dependent methyltransferase
MIDTVVFKEGQYPAFQTNGNAARFIMPFAKEVLRGEGLDIGGGNEQWKFPGARLIDLSVDDEYHANNLPDHQYDYIFSSHCLEHLPDWVGVLDYWSTRIRPGGVMFLYLPHYSQEYWRPWNNRKHVNILLPQFIRDYFEARGWEKIFVSEVDLYNSFAAMGVKR